MRGRLIAEFGVVLVLGLAGCTGSPDSGAVPQPAPKVQPAPADTATAASTGTVQSALMPLVLKPTRPQYFYTPRSFAIDPHREPWTPWDKVRPPLMVPEGCTNLALKKPVTASDDYIIVGDLPLVTDGDTGSSYDWHLELGPGLQWIQIDLGQEACIYAVALFRCAEGQVAYYDVVIQISDDPKFAKNVKTVFNNDYDNSAGLGVGKDMEYVDDWKGRAIPVDGVTGRYVRLWSNGGDLHDTNEYAEVEVYGKPSE
jgi:hypothetical protein